MAVRSCVRRKTAKWSRATGDLLQTRRGGSEWATGGAANPGDLALFSNAFGNLCEKQLCAGLSRIPNLSNDEELTGALNGERSEKEIEMFVDRARGIAFEFRAGAAADPDARGYCRAIHIFAPNTNPRPIQNFEEASKEE